METTPLQFSHSSKNEEMGMLHHADSGITVMGPGVSAHQVDLLEITPLGAGSEVGRSCHIIKYKGKTVMVCSYWLKV